MNPEALTSTESSNSIERSPTSKKISNLILAVSALALSVVGACSKNPSQDGSKHTKPSLHLSCFANGNSPERTNQVTNLSNIKLTQDMLSTNCTYYTVDMVQAGNQIPVTVSCDPKEKNEGTISKKIDGVTIKVSQSDVTCKILNK